MTRKDTLEQIKALGMSARYSAEWGEYRVTLRAEDEPSRERREAIAYYTHDAEDALGTARAMRETFDQQQAAKAEGQQLDTARHVEGIADMKGAAFEAACEAKEESNFRDFMQELDAESAALDAELTRFTPDEIPESPLYEQTERGTYRATDEARAAIEQLAANLPDAERHPLHRDEREPTEADATRHAMTGEEPRRLSAFEKATARANTPEAKAQRLAQRQTLQARGYDGPEL